MYYYIVISPSKDWYKESGIIGVVDDETKNTLFKLGDEYVLRDGVRFDSANETLYVRDMVSDMYGFLHFHGISERKEDIPAQMTNWIPGGLILSLPKLIRQMC